MSKGVCPAGKIWNKFLDSCAWVRQKDPQRQPRPPRPPAVEPTAAEPTAAEPTAAEPTYAPTVTSGVLTAPWIPTGPTAGPYLWAAVAVVATGSILALVLWFLIYRQHRNCNNWAPPPALQHTDQTDPLPGVHQPLVPGSYPAEPLRKVPEPSGPHFDGVHVNDITSCVARLSPRVTWVGETGATGRKHRVPLPATELGDTTLVTAKTGRDQYSPV